MERNKPIELASDILAKAGDVATFLVDRLVKLDGWVHQPHFDTEPTVANIQVHEAQQPVDYGE